MVTSFVVSVFTRGLDRAGDTRLDTMWRPPAPLAGRSVRKAHVLPFPKSQGKTLRTINVIERLHEEFRRRVKTQGSLPTEEAALVLLFGLAGGQIRLRRLDDPGRAQSAPAAGGMTRIAL